MRRRLLPCCVAVAVASAGCSVVYGVDVPSEVMFVDPAGDADGDGQRNDEDPCPLRYQEEPGDRDGDGIGDQCDPDPGNNREPDCVILFDRFGGAGKQSIDPRWKLVGTSPDFPGNDQVLFPTTDDRPAIVYAEGPFEPHTIVLDYYVANPLDGPTRSLRLLLAPRIDGDDAVGESCGLVDATTGIDLDDASVTWTTLQKGGNEADRASAALPAPATSTGTIRWSARACAVNQTDSFITTGGPAGSSGAIGFRGKDLNVEISSIVAYSKACP